jgi:hypothetical protein
MRFGMLTYRSILIWVKRKVIVRSKGSLACMRYLNRLELFVECSKAGVDASIYYRILRLNPRPPKLMGFIQCIFLHMF